MLRGVVPVLLLVDSPDGDRWPVLAEDVIKEGEAGKARYFTVSVSISVSVSVSYKKSPLFIIATTDITL